MEKIFNKIYLEARVYVFNNYSFFKDDSFLDDRITDKSNISLEKKSIMKYFKQANDGAPSGIKGFITNSEQRFRTDNAGNNYYDIGENGVSLYTELGKPINGDKQILNFIKTWGLPDGLNMPIWEDKGRLHLPYTFNTQASENLCLWCNDYYSLLNKWEQYRKDFRKFEAIISKDWKYLDAIEGYFTHGRLTHPHSPTMAKQLFSRTLKEHMKNAYSLTVNDKGRFVQKSIFYNLFDIAYFQMARALSENVKFQRCKYCGHLFEVNYKGMSFCPPLPFHSRSSCEMAYTNRIKRAWKLYKEGKTLEEIDKKVSLPIEEIKDYIQRRESGK